MKQFKKKVARITGILILSLGLFMSPLFVDSSKATNNIWDYNFTSTNQGVTATASGYGCVFADYYASNSTQNTRYKHVITINFSDYVSGSVHLIFTFSRGDIFLSRYCTLGFTSSTSGFDVYVYNTNYCEIEVYTQYETSFLLDILSHAGSDSTSDHYLLTDATEYLYYIDQNMQSVQSDIADIKQYLDDSDLDSVAGYLDTINQYVYNDLDDYLHLLLYLEDQNTGVGYLQEIYQFVQNLNITDYSTAFNDILNALTTVNTNTSNIYTRLNSINTTLTSISTSLQTSLHTNLNIPRWQILAYRWAVSVGYSTGQYSTWSSTTSTGWLNRYTNPDGDHQFTPAKGHYLLAGTSSQPNSRKYIIAWASTSANNGSTYNIHWSNTYTSGWHADCFYGTATNGGYRDGVYFNYVIVYNEYTPQASNRAFEIEFNNRIYISPIYVGYLDVMPDEACTLLGFQKTDQLLEAAESYFSDSLNLLQQIVDGISSISTTQTVINEADQVNIDFNTVMNNVNNVEVNLLNGIDNKFSDVNTSISNSNVLSSFVVIQNAKSWADLMIGYIFYWLNPIKYPIYIVLIGFVLLCLLG